MNALLTLFLTRLLWAGQNPLQATGTPVCNPSEQFQINVFDDFLEPGVVSWSWGGDYDFENASPVFEVGIKRDFFFPFLRRFTNERFGHRWRSALCNYAILYLRFKQGTASVGVAYDAFGGFSLRFFAPFGAVGESLSFFVLMPVSETGVALGDASNILFNLQALVPQASATGSFPLTDFGTITPGVWSP